MSLRSFCSKAQTSENVSLATCIVDRRGGTGAAEGRGTTRAMVDDGSEVWGWSVVEGGGRTMTALGRVAIMRG